MVRGEEQQRIGERIGRLNRRRRLSEPFGFRCLDQCF
jgi:hypothetical protein